jgi:hypothetical protein
MNPRDIYLPPLHTKIGFTKSFVKDLEADIKFFTYLRNKLPEMSDVQVKSESLLAQR